MKKKSKNILEKREIMVGENDSKKYFERSFGAEYCI